MPRHPVSPESLADQAGVLAPAFDCSLREGGRNAAWVHLSGELDVDTTPLLEWALRAPGSHTQLIVLDMRDVAFMDSSGVHAIVNAGARERQLGRRLVILRGPPAVDRVFALTGNTRFVEDGDVAAVDPSVQALLRLDEMERGA